MGKKQVTYKKHVPTIVSTSDLQRKSGQIIDCVQESAEPYFVVKNNKTKAVIVNIEEYERLKKMQYEWEMADALDSIRVAEEAKKNGTLIELKPPFDEFLDNLLKDND